MSKERNTIATFQNGMSIRTRYDGEIRYTYNEVVSHSPYSSNEIKNMGGIEILDMDFMNFKNGVGRIILQKNSFPHLKTLKLRNLPQFERSRRLNNLDVMELDQLEEIVLDNANVVTLEMSSHFYYYGKVHRKNAGYFRDSHVFY